MKEQPTVTIEASGTMVKLIVGVSSALMTMHEAEEMVRALERAIDESRLPRPQTRVH